MSLHRFIVVGLTLLIGTAGPAVAQPGKAATGTVSGTVLGPDGMPVPGVVVFVRRDNVDLAIRAVTDSGGVFLIAGLPSPASYRLISAIGALEEEGPQVTLPAGAALTGIEVRLRLAIAEQVSVTSDVWTLPVDAPNSTVSRTAEQLRAQNLFNPEDAVRNLPSTTIRKRYIGDRNALLGGRSFGTLQPARALVFLDGYLLSNFLGRFDAPRWNMVTPEALERVDVMYGPFSAVHPGNSMGTTIVMSERTPTKLEWGFRATGASQRLDQYDTADRYGAGQLSAYVGTRAASGFWGAAAFNHQDSVSQPMQWFNVTANAAGGFPAATGSAVPVSGVRYDVDPRGARRAVFGANAGAIDHTVQDAVKVRGGYARPGSYDLSVLASVWRNDTANRNETFLQDAAGAPVWQGVVTDGTERFTIPATAFAPSLRDETHSQLGFTLRSRRALGWNGSLIVSDYRILDDRARQALAPDPVAATGGPGTVTRRDGTGWGTIEAQATRTPFGNGRHTVTFGAHRNAYRLDNAVKNSSQWREDETTLAQRYTGRSSVNALYAQNVMRLRDDVKVTVGWRAEWFTTTDGTQVSRLATCVPGGGATCDANGDGTFNKVLGYGERTLSGQSPKASLTWTATDSLLLRASFGHAVRFPNVEELYNGTVTATSVTVSDPNLKAERSNALELSVEHFWAAHTLRATFFADDVRDAILRQSDATVTPSIVRTSNVDRVRTPGLEFVWVAKDLVARGVTVEANATFANSKVIENTRDPLMVDKYWLRVPKTRGSLVLAYRPTARWLGSVGYRHQGRAFNDVYNLDVNPNVYGGVSSVDQFDLRVSYKPLTVAEFALGIDNVTGQHAFQSHPFPGRTAFFELRLASH